MSENLKLGHIIEGEQHRDAIHIAVAPVTAAERLSPGQHVGMMADGRAGTTRKRIGVVDPYLHDDVEPGDRFWLFLYPGSITSLRHEWTHPAMPSADAMPTPATGDRAASEQWLRAFASKWNMGYGEMIQGAELADGITARDIDIHSWGELGHGVADQFWRHLEIVTGKTFDAAHRAETYFSCSC